MKIGMILDSIYPDDARITNQCEELINSKHEVFLFCLSSTGIFKIFIAWFPISITKDFAFSESRLNNEFEKRKKIINKYLNKNFIIPLFYSTSNS